MRDLSRASGMSLAGLYYYFESKEKLLYLIQNHTFTTIVDRLRSRLEGVTDPEARIRVFILQSSRIFPGQPEGHESPLARGRGPEERLRRGDRRHQARVFPHLRRTAGRPEAAKGLEFSSRTAVLSLFGMMNWIYTWYNPRVDGDAAELAREMGDIFLQGISGRRAAEGSSRQKQRTEHRS